MYSEKICISEREQLRQQVALCDTLPYTVKVLREQLNVSTTREEEITNELEHISTKLGVSALLFKIFSEHTLFSSISTVYINQQCTKSSMNSLLSRV